MMRITFVSAKDYTVSASPTPLVALTSFGDIPAGSYLKPIVRDYFPVGTVITCSNASEVGTCTITARDR